MQYTLRTMLTQRAFGLAILIAAQVKASRSYIKVTEVVATVNMSKVTTIKNQNKLRVYLEKIKNEPDVKSNNKANNDTRKRPRTN
jgi:hypothetical protein